MVQICTYHGIKHGEDLARLSFWGDMTISNGRHDRDCEKEHLSGLELCCIIGNIKLPLKRSKRLASEWKCKSWSNIGKCPLEVPGLHLPIVVVLLHSFHHLPHGSSRYEHIHIWSSLYTTMHHIWSALYTTLSTNIRISASAWKNWFQIVVGIKLTEINHMLEKVGEIFTYYQMEKVGESWTQSNVDLLVEVSLVEPSLHVVAVHQHPPLLRQEVGNHLAQRKSFLQTVFSCPSNTMYTT